MMQGKGFTLVELAIVITIIGLLIAGVLKGQSLINDAKVSSAITLAQDISVAVNAFKQQYHLLPGDMLITTEFPTLRTECLTGAKKGNNNGIIEAGLSGVPDESSCVPEVLFLAGLAKVDQENNVPVFKSYYGSVTVKAASQSTVSGFSPSIIHIVEFSNLPCDFVQAMDRKMDNDNLANGKAIAIFTPDPNNPTTCLAGSIVPYYAVSL